MNDSGVQMKVREHDVDLANTPPGAGDPDWHWHMGFSAGLRAGQASAAEELAPGIALHGEIRRELSRRLDNAVKGNYVITAIAAGLLVALVIAL